MRIAFIVHDYHKTGGHSRYVYELSSRFARDHEVHVFANRIDGERDPRIAFHHIPAMRFYALASVLTFIVPATLQRLARFDIVHAQGLCGLRQNVVTAHMCQPAWYAAQEKHVGALTLKQKIFRAAAQPFEKFIFQPHSTRTVIAVSKRVANDLEQYYHRTENVSVVYHGVDLETFNPGNRNRFRAAVRSELNLADDRFTALYVGDLQKAGRPAIEAISRIPDANLICVSSSDPEPYRDVARQYGAADRIHFLPNTSTIERYYAAADVFVFPSFYDTFGMVVSEAMASGLPVIASRAAGAAELIEHSVSGIVMDEAWDVAALTQWVERLKLDATMRDNIGRAGRAAIERFTWDKTAAETMSVYLSILPPVLKK
jgi:UDP-glucose:(heptosyl)LPS alpha-1,3-glucosyltransferase